ncbi:serine hydrolase [Salinimicrobium catena]|uniref:serine hydrolase domain-containing protein n=1 Tax=Salinimicrobium catena TaxID=390640 RepID=UPI002FE48957
MNKIFKISLLLILLAIIVVAVLYYPRLNLITGFAAKNMCSCTFISEREPANIAATDNGFEPVSMAKSEVNAAEKYASSEVFGLKERTAVFIPGIGCTLVPEDVENKERTTLTPNRSREKITRPYPFGHEKAVDTTFSEVNYDRLETALDSAFAPRNLTRAVVVLYRDHLLAERYSEGFSEDTKLLGWSMTKSITSAVLGILHRQGTVSLEQDHLFEEWNEDERSAITLNNLLQMNSGLAWEEDYTKISDVTKMLFLSEDMSEVQLQKSMVGEPGSAWNYSSGTTNLLSALIRDQFDTHQEYLDFWYSELIDKIGMHSMVVETDLAGNYVGSSYAWATPRDWARFGLLYLNKGEWNGEQVLEPSWIDYTVKPTPGSDGEYGAHFWLNAGGVYPNVPKDLFSANGFHGQHVFVIPSKDLVVVRFGLKEHPEFNIDTFLSRITDSLGKG